MSKIKAFIEKLYLGVKIFTIVVKNGKEAIEEISELLK